MSRSLKKGPFVDFKTFRKVERQIEKGSTSLFKLGRVPARLFLSLWVSLFGP